MAKKGKYEGIIDKLPRHLGVDPPYQEKVLAVKDQIVKMDGDELISSQEIQEHIAVIHDHSMKLLSLMLRASNGNKRAVDYARVYRQLREIKELLETHESSVNLLIESYTQLLVDQYEVEGIKSLRLDTGESVRVQYEPKAVVENYDALRQWAIKSGLERSMTLAWQTVNAITKERLLKGEPEPDGVKAYSITKMVLET